MAQTMLLAMLLMTFCFWAYSMAVALQRARAMVLERDRYTDWAQQLPEVRRGQT
jgi:heme exporter protein C